MNPAVRAAACAAAWAPLAAAAECPVTLPSVSPVVVPGVVPEGTFWYGSEALAVRLSSDGIWRGMGPAHNYGDKLWFWRRSYSPELEPVPALSLKGVKLDDAASTLHIDRATNAFGPGWSSMLVGMEFPSSGCWKITATYTNFGITEDIDFIVDVIDSDSMHDR
jgi:hypothetical protein